MKGELVLNAVLTRLSDILALGDTIFSLTPSELIQKNVCSPIRLFIKDEPHKLAKIQQGKLRLISGVAVDDQILDRMIFGVQNNTEIDLWDQIPSKPGIGLDDHGLLKMSKTFKQMLEKGPLRSTDISGWDWSVQDWELKADVEARIQLAGASDGSLFAFLARVRAYCVARKVFVLPDGTMVAQIRPGVQASGWYCTSSTNSRMRILAKVVAHLLWCEERGVAVEDEDLTNMISMGDDAVEGATDDGVLQYLEELGHTVKEVQLFDSLEGVEFCSHRWMHNGLAFPVTVWKTLFRFFSHPPTSASYLDWYSQLRNDLRNHPSWTTISEVALAHAEWAKSNGERKESAAHRSPQSRQSPGSQ